MEKKFRAWVEKEQFMAIQGEPDLETLQSFIFHYGNLPLDNCLFVKDINGKELFENDIVRISVYENKNKSFDGFTREEILSFDIDFMKGNLRESYIALIVYDEGSFITRRVDEHDETYLCVLFGDMRFSYPMWFFEIIGNAHQNPELLK